MFMKIVKALTLLSILFVYTACNKTEGALEKASKQLKNPYEVVGDHTLGNPKALITIIEYASLTCVHCAHFHKTIWPDLKKKYVDTGKVYYIFRPFPTPPVQISVAETLIAGCTTGKEQFFKAVGLFLGRQRAIFTEAQQGRGREALLTISREVGLTEKDVDRCLEDEKAIKKLQNTVETGIKKYNIDATPSFIINGKLDKLVVVNDGIETFDKALKPLLGIREKGNKGQPKEKK